MIDCTIIDNTSTEYCGAGIRSLYQNLTLINCTVSNNTADRAGGGIYFIEIDEIVKQKVVKIE